MSASFLHGLESIEVNVGPRPVTVVKSAVILLVGTAPAGPVEETTIVSGSRDAAQFGEKIVGYTIPYALDQIQQQGAGQVIVVNVCPQTTVTNEAKSFSGSNPQTVTLDHKPVAGVVVKNEAADTTYTLNKDYTVDAATGVITAVASGALTTDQAVKVSYYYTDASAIDENDVIGDFDANTGTYTGMQLGRMCFAKFGFGPKILIAPGFSQEQVVAAAMDSLARKIRAMSLVDCPTDTPVVQDVISSRGDTGEAFGLSSNRTVLCYPNLQFTDLGSRTDGQDITNPTTGPYSAWLAGAIAAQDAENGYWYSPSNKVLTGPLGPDVSIYMSAFDPNSDTNNINAAGIVTVFNSFGTGLRVWGNRSSAFPASTAPDNFIPIRRTLDILEDSVELFALQYLDGPITNGFITAVLQSVNAFIRTLVQRGALEPGSKATYDSNVNPPSELAAGHVVFDLIVMPPPPAERITFNVRIDTSLLANITGAAQATA